MPGYTSMPSVKVAASPECAALISVTSRHYLYVCIDARGSVISTVSAWQAVAQTLECQDKRSREMPMRPRPENFAKASAIQVKPLRPYHIQPERRRRRNENGLTQDRKGTVSVKPMVVTSRKASAAQLATTNPSRKFLTPPCLESAPPFARALTAIPEPTIIFSIPVVEINIEKWTNDRCTRFLSGRTSWL